MTETIDVPAEEMDILDRLRFHADPDHMPGQELTAHIFTLAADEIERLRARIEEWEEKLADGPDWDE